MKPYAIIREQPELYNVVKVHFTQQINPQINVNAIKNPKPNKLDHFSTVHVHTVPKYYQQRKSRLPSYERLYKSAGKYHKKPIFKQLDYKDLNLVGLKKSEKQRQNEASKENNSERKEMKKEIIQQTAQKIDQYATPKKIQKFEQNEQKQDMSNTQQQRHNQSSSLSKYKHIPIFANRRYGDLGQSKIMNGGRAPQSKSLDLQKMRNSRVVHYQHKLIFSKENKAELAQSMRLKSSNKLSFCNHLCQIKYDGVEPAPKIDKIKQQQHENRSQCQSTAKKMPVYETPSQQQQPKIKFQYQNCKTQPTYGPQVYQQRKFYPPPSSVPNTSLRNSKVQFTYQSPSISQIKDLKQSSNHERNFKKVISLQTQQSPKKFKKVIGLKSSKKNKEKNNTKYQQVKAPKIIKLKALKSRKSSSQHKRAKSQHSSQKMKQQSQCGSEISIKIIKILQMAALQI